MMSDMLARLHTVCGQTLDDSTLNDLAGPIRRGMAAGFAWGQRLAYIISRSIQNDRVDFFGYRYD